MTSRRFIPSISPLIMRKAHTKFHHYIYRHIYKINAIVLKLPAPINGVLLGIYRYRIIKWFFQAKEKSPDSVCLHKHCPGQATGSHGLTMSAEIMTRANPTVENTVW